MNVGGAQFWYSYRNPEVKYYIPVIQDITVEATDLKDKVLVKVINNGIIPAEFVRGTEVFFGGNKVLGYNTQYFCDSELKPGASMTDQMDYYNLDGKTIHLKCPPPLEDLHCRSW